MVLPSGVGEAVGWIEDGDGAALVALASRLPAGRDGERRGGGGDGLAVLEEAALVVLTVIWTISAMLALATTSKCSLTVQRVKRDDGGGRHAEFGQQRLRRRNLVRLLGYVDMGEHERGIGCERAEQLRGGTIIESVEAAAERFSVERDTAVFRRGMRGLEEGRVAAERGFHVAGIKALDDIADRGVRGGRAAI